MTCHRHRRPGQRHRRRRRHADGLAGLRTCTHGSLRFNANGTFTYTPTAGFSGTDSFTYKDYDGLESSSVATVTITVTENATGRQQRHVYRGSRRDALGHDHRDRRAGQRHRRRWRHAHRARWSRACQHGTLTLERERARSPTRRRRFHRHRQLHLRGQRRTGVQQRGHGDHRRHRQRPGRQERHLFHRAWPDPLGHGTTSTGVLSNDTDADGDYAHRLAGHRRVARHPDVQRERQFTYIPTAGFYGTDSFTYQDSDGAGGSSVATVTITVNENHTGRQQRHVYHGSRRDPLGHVHFHQRLVQRHGRRIATTLTASLVSNVQHGTLSLAPTGTSPTPPPPVSPAPTASPTRTTTGGLSAMRPR